MKEKEPQMNATNSYELKLKYFQLSGAPIETDAAYAYRNHEPQINADERRFVIICGLNDSQLIKILEK